VYELAFRPINGTNIFISVVAKSRYQTNRKRTGVTAYTWLSLHHCSLFSSLLLWSSLETIWYLSGILVKMEFIKDESDAEACRVRDEDTDEQIGWWVFINETVLSLNRVVLCSSGDWGVLSIHCSQCFCPVSNSHVHEYFVKCSFSQLFLYQPHTPFQLKH